MKRQKLKMFGVFVLVTVFTLNKFNLSILKGATNTKTMTVTIGEGPLDVSTLSKTVNIPNLKSVVKVTSNTGIAAHSISGTNVTINASGGIPTRTVNNPKKYSKNVSNSKTNGTNTFSETNPYSDADGYIGTLNKNGNVIDIVKSGSPAGSKNVTFTEGPQASYNFPNSVLFTDSEGYEGYINKLGNAYSAGKAVVWEERSTALTVENHDSNPYPFPSTHTFLWEYFEKGVRKEVFVTFTKGAYHYEYITDTFPNYCYHYQEYRGLAPSEVNVYEQKYAGEVYKPDTRVYEYIQNYSGIAYKAGIDNYYSYTVTIEYVDNQAPTIQAITSPTPGTVRSSVSGYTNLIVSGAVKDVDVGDTLKVYYRINGTSGSAGVLLETLTASGSDQTFTGSTDVSSLSEGNHTIYIWVEDSAGDRSAEVSRNFSLDKTAPVITIEPYITEWTNQDITVIATTNEGTLNQNSYTFTENGSFTFVATDIVGNQTEKIVTITNIDKNKPILTIKVGR